MKPDEAECLIPTRNTNSSSDFSMLVKAQLKLNAQSLSVNTDHQGGQVKLIVNLKVPVYLISAIEEGSGADLTLPGSCSEWMLSEAAWSDILGGLLVGTEYRVLLVTTSQCLPMLMLQVQLEQCSTLLML